MKKKEKMVLCKCGGKAVIKGRVITCSNSPKCPTFIMYRTCKESVAHWNEAFKQKEKV